MPDIYSKNSHEWYMSEALKEAQIAYEKDEVPVGAVLVQNGQIIARAHNLKESLASATKHAEVLVIEMAAKALGRWRLNDCELYVTLEPCPMCAGAIWSARVSKLYFGTEDPKSGYIKSVHQLFDQELLNHKTECHSGVLKEDCSLILKDFFKQKRSSAKT